MNRETQELYDEVCRVLTWYEHPEEDPIPSTASEVAEMLYDTLCKVQNWMCANGFDGSVIDRQL